MGVRGDVVVASNRALPAPSPPPGPPDDGNHPDWVGVLPSDDEPRTVAIACQTVPDFHAPTWPDGPVPTQVHFDFYVDSIADSEPAVFAALARPHDHQRSPTPTGGSSCTSTQWGIRFVCAWSDGAGTDRVPDG